MGPTAMGRGSSFEMGGNGHAVNGAGHGAVPVNGNGRSEEADEPQQSLFSPDCSYMSLSQKSASK